MNPRERILNAFLGPPVDRAREMIRQGRYVPCWDHLIPPDVSWDNYRYAAERIRDLCRRQQQREDICH